MDPTSNQDRVSSRMPSLANTTLTPRVGGHRDQAPISPVVSQHKLPLVATVLAAQLTSKPGFLPREVWFNSSRKKVSHPGRKRTVALVWQPPKRGICTNEMGKTDLIRSDHLITAPLLDY